jgi:hypothetical protein
MDTEMLTALERAFSALSPEERETIIRHGVALRVVDLKKRLFLAESMIHSFVERYQTTLEQLDAEGLPDDASYEMHEDYIMWHHWVAVAQKVAQDMQALQDIAQQGLFGTAIADMGSGWSAPLEDVHLKPAGVRGQRT